MICLNKYFYLRLQEISNRHKFDYAKSIFLNFKNVFVRRAWLLS